MLCNKIKRGTRNEIKGNAKQDDESIKIVTATLSTANFQILSKLLSGLLQLAFNNIFKSVNISHLHMSKIK